MLQRFSSNVPFRGLSRNPFTEDPACTLGRRTVIYGRNGAGKTTFTEALRLASKYGTADSATVTARTFRNGAVETVRLAPDTIPFAIFVYNRYYVQDSLQLFLDGGQALPILKLGSESVKAQSDLNEMEGYLGTLGGRLTGLDAAMRRIEQERDVVERQVKADIISALAPADAAYYNQTRFQVTQVRKLLGDSASASLTVDALQVETIAATATVVPAAALPGKPPAVDPGLHDKINVELLGSPVESSRIPRLAGNPALAEWVETGLSLHTVGARCEFCQSGTITADTLQLYRQHFSAALESLRERLKEALADLAGTREALDAWVTALPAAEAFLPDHREQARSVRSTLEVSVAALKDALDEATSAIQRRLADPLNPLPETDLLANAFPRVDARAIVDLVARNNAAVNSQAARAKQARSAVEGHYAAARAAEYATLAERLARGQRAKATLRRRVEAVEAEALALRQSQQDVGRIANLIDSDLREHFGHAHLRLSVSSDGKGYVVTRGGAVASRLSEGERNAIAFAYFLRSLEAEGVDPSTSVVLIDDPVTSLDREALFAAHSLAEARTSGFAQTVVLTHDYEYFRLQLLAHRNRWCSSQKRIRKGDETEGAFPEVSLLELRAVVPADAGARSGELRPIATSLVQHPSEYHFLFFHIAEAVQGHSDEYLPLVGNAGRRLLEGFLSFRAPNKITFQDKVDAVADAASIDACLKERVVKFLHSQSHREEPRPSAALDFPSIQAELVAALTFVNRADPAHFVAMCRAVAVDPEALVGALAAHPAP